MEDDEWRRHGKQGDDFDDDTSPFDSEERRQRQELFLAHAATTRIIAQWRGVRQQRQVSNLRKATVKIGANARRLLAQWRARAAQAHEMRPLIVDVIRVSGHHNATKPFVRVATVCSSSDSPRCFVQKAAGRTRTVQVGNDDPPRAVEFGESLVLCGNSHTRIVITLVDENEYWHRDDFVGQSELEATERIWGCPRTTTSINLGNLVYDDLKEGTATPTLARANKTGSGKVLICVRPTPRASSHCGWLDHTAIGTTPSWRKMWVVLARDTLYIKADPLSHTTQAVLNVEEATHISLKEENNAAATIISVRFESGGCKLRASRSKSQLWHRKILRSAPHLGNRERRSQERAVELEEAFRLRAQAREFLRKAEIMRNHIPSNASSYLPLAIVRLNAQQRQTMVATAAAQNTQRLPRSTDLNDGGKPREEDSTVDEDEDEEEEDEDEEGDEHRSSANGDDERLLSSVARVALVPAMWLLGASAQDTQRVFSPNSQQPRAASTSNSDDETERGDNEMGLRLGSSGNDGVQFEVEFPVDEPLGITFEWNADAMVIAGFPDGAPNAGAGQLRASDRLIAVNGIDVRHLGSEEVASTLQLQAGTATGQGAVLVFERNVVEQRHLWKLRTTEMEIQRSMASVERALFSHAALAIQAASRRRIAVNRANEQRSLRNFILLDSAALRVQSTFRRIQAERKLDELYCFDAAALNVQSAFRVFKAQQLSKLRRQERQLQLDIDNLMRLRESATIRLQSQWRANRAREVCGAKWKDNRDRAALAASILLQSRWRARAARSRVLSHREERAILRLQCAWRIVRALRNTDLERASRRIGARWRAARVRRQFCDDKRLITRLARTWRGRAESKKILEMAAEKMRPLVVLVQRCQLPRQPRRDGGRLYVRVCVVEAASQCARRRQTSAAQTTTARVVRVTHAQRRAGDDGTKSPPVLLSAKKMRSGARQRPLVAEFDQAIVLCAKAGDSLLITVAEEQKLAFKDDFVGQATVRLLPGRNRFWQSITHADCLFRCERHELGLGSCSRPPEDGDSQETAFNYPQQTSGATLSLEVVPLPRAYSVCGWVERYVVPRLGRSVLTFIGATQAWERLWCVLARGQLLFYRGPSHVVPVDTLELASITDVSLGECLREDGSDGIGINIGIDVGQEQGRARRSRFSETPTDDKWVLVCDDGAEKIDEWLRKIQRCSPRVRSDHIEPQGVAVTIPSSPVFSTGLRHGDSDGDGGDVGVMDSEQTSAGNLWRDLDRGIDSVARMVAHLVDDVDGDKKDHSSTDGEKQLREASHPPVVIQRESSSASNNAIMAGVVLIPQYFGTENSLSSPSAGGGDGGGCVADTKEEKHEEEEEGDSLSIYPVEENTAAMGPQRGSHKVGGEIDDDDAAAAAANNAVETERTEREMALKFSEQLLAWKRRACHDRKKKAKSAAGGVSAGRRASWGLGKGGRAVAAKARRFSAKNRGDNDGDRPASAVPTNSGRLSETQQQQDGGRKQAALDVPTHALATRTSSSAKPPESHNPTATGSRFLSNDGNVTDVATSEPSSSAAATITTRSAGSSAAKKMRRARAARAKRNLLQRQEQQAVGVAVGKESGGGCPAELDELGAGTLRASSVGVQQTSSPSSSQINSKKQFKPETMDWNDDGKRAFVRSSKTKQARARARAKIRRGRRSGAENDKGR